MDYGKGWKGRGQAFLSLPMSMAGLAVPALPRPSNETLLLKVLFPIPMFSFSMSSLLLLHTRQHFTELGGEKGVPARFPEAPPDEVASSGRRSGVTGWSQRCGGRFQTLCCLLCSKRALYSCQLEQRLTSWSALTLLLYLLSLSRCSLSFRDSFSRF